MSISLEELQLAARNHGLPLEALRYPITPAGLHYLLIHYDIPRVEPEGWTLEVGGLVERPLLLTLDDIRARPTVETAVTLECAGNGRALLSPRAFSQPWIAEAVGTALWRGTPLSLLLEEAAPREGAVDVVFTGVDRGVEDGVELSFERSLALEDALDGDAILAYEINGQPLPPQHGFPLRLIMPGWYGMASVKWLSRITLVDQPFGGYQQASAYRLRQTQDEPGTPLTRMLPRALMVPPGIPDFPTRRRTLRAGTTLLEGRAWSGFAPVERVDVSTDGGRSWGEARLEHDVDSPWAWVGWRYEWHAEPGAREVCCRARDEAGNEQPLEPAWNLGGYANNAVQRVPVTVV